MTPERSRSKKHGLSRNPHSTKQRAGFWPNMAISRILQNPMIRPSLKLRAWVGTDQGQVTLFGLWVIEAGSSFRRGRS